MIIPDKIITGRNAGRITTGHGQSIFLINFSTIRIKDSIPKNPVPIVSEHPFLFIKLLLL